VPEKKLKGAGPKTFVPKLSPCLAAHHVDKFGEVIPTGPKLILAYLLNFAPVFEFLFSPKFLWT